MNSLNQFKAVPPLLIAFTLLCIGLLPGAQAVVPAPDGGYPGFTTAEGTNALKNLTTGVGNTATGWHSLFANTAGNLNTGVGAGTLLFNAGDNNTATGALALLNNTGGFYNTADGAFALLSNTEGSGNTGSGYGALFSNQDGANNAAYGYTALYNNTASFNTACGSQTLVYNTFGEFNTATGYQALVFNTQGNFNTASGPQALYSNTTGAFNTAVGAAALAGNSTGNANIGIGYRGGLNLTTGVGNIDIGNEGVAGEANTMRLGTSGVQTATYIAGIYGTFNMPNSGVVYVDPDGKLGTGPSARRFKKDIADMGAASEALLSMRPVTFHFKTQDTEKAGQPVQQFGLIAEEVAEVNPDLVLRDRDGKIYSVRYDQVNAMLLNEFLKEHKKVEQLEGMVASLAATVKEQAARIEKVSGQIELSRFAAGRIRRGGSVSGMAATDY